MSIADYLHNKAHHICQHNPLISNDQNQKRLWLTTLLQFTLKKYKQITKYS